MTRHPTTAEMRRVLTALLTTPPVVTTPLSPVEQAARDERLRHARPLNHRGNEVEDATIGNEVMLRGIPAVGRVSGTMKGTRPGDNLRL